MSFKAMAFVAEQNITTTAPQTLLLMMMANYANEHDETYPSIETLSKLTRMDKRTVRKCLQELMDLELIFDTQKRYKKQIVIYKINTQRGNKNDTPCDDERGNKNDTPNKNVGGTNLYQRGNKFVSQGGTNLHKGGTNLLPNTIIKPINEPIIEPVSYDTHTHEAPQTPKNPKTPKADNLAKIEKSVKAYLIDLGVDNQIADDFIYFRKEIKKPLTITAINRLITETEKTNLDLNSAIEFTLDKGWQSFTAEYYLNHINSIAGEKNATNQADEYRNKLMAEYDAFYGTNSQSPIGESHYGNVYDVAG